MDLNVLLQMFLPVFVCYYLSVQLCCLMSMVTTPFPTEWCLIESRICNTLSLAFSLPQLSSNVYLNIWRLDLQFYAIASRLCWQNWRGKVSVFLVTSKRIPFSHTHIPTHEHTHTHTHTHTHSLSLSLFLSYTNIHIAWRAHVVQINWPHNTRSIRLIRWMRIHLLL